jgi:hypothetical protein
MTTRLPGASRIERVAAGEVVDVVEAVDRRHDRTAPRGDDDLLGGDRRAAEFDRPVVDERRVFTEQLEVLPVAVPGLHVRGDAAQQVVHLVYHGRVVDALQRRVDVEPAGVADVLGRVGGLDEISDGLHPWLRQVPPSGPRSTSAVSSPESAAAAATLLPVPPPMTRTSKSAMRTSSTRTPDKELLAAVRPGCTGARRDRNRTAHPTRLY